jgi:DNA-binding Lrp family transcriptional regulator
MKLSLVDQKIINRLLKGLSLKERIFSDICSDLGIEQDYLIARLKFFKRKGLLKRIAPSINFIRLGYVKNALLAAHVVKLSTSFMKEKLKDIPNVTHCVIRKHSPEFNYNLFMMIHAKSSCELNETVKIVKNIFCLQDYKVLLTKKEHKKTNFHYNG